MFPAPLRMRLAEWAWGSLCCLGSQPGDPLGQVRPLLPPARGSGELWGETPACDQVYPLLPGPGEAPKSLPLLSLRTLQLIPSKVKVELENTNVVLSVNSQQR